MIHLASTHYTLPAGSFYQLVAVGVDTHDFIAHPVLLCGTHTLVVDARDTMLRRITSNAPCFHTLSHTTHCQLGLYPRADRYLTPFRSFRACCCTIRSCLMYRQPLNCKVNTTKLPHSDETRAGTINFFGCDKHECIRAYHRSDLREMCVANVCRRSLADGRRQRHSGERGRIISEVDIRRDTAVTCVKRVPGGCVRI